MNKKILFCTNSRSEMSTVLSMLSETKKSEVISPFLIVGGTHFSPKYGYTSNYITRRGFRIDFCARYFDDNESLAVCLGNSIPIFCEALEQLDPDIVVITGDRVECLPLITACLLRNKPIAHVSGGDTTLGAIDNNIRHMISKASLLHFVAMESHKQKLIELGEHPETVYVTGDPAIDSIKSMERDENAAILASFGLKFGGDYALCTFHPQTIDIEHNAVMLKNMLDALRKRPEFKIFTFPNGDPGSEQVIRTLKNFIKHDKQSALIQSFNGDDYYKILAGASFIIGNSSSALWECPTLRVPAINLGNRQKGRIRAGNVIDVCGLDLMDIETAITEARSSQFYEKLCNTANPYGDGGAGRRIVKLLENLDFEDLFQFKEQVG